MKHAALQKSEVNDVSEPLYYHAMKDHSKSFNLKLRLGLLCLRCCTYIAKDIPCPLEMGNRENYVQR